MILLLPEKLFINTDNIITVRKNDKGLDRMYPGGLYPYVISTVGDVIFLNQKQTDALFAYLPYVNAEGDV